MMIATLLCLLVEQALAGCFESHKLVEYEESFVYTIGPVKTYQPDTLPVTADGEFLI